MQRDTVNRMRYLVLASALGLAAAILILSAASTFCTITVHADSFQDYAGIALFFILLGAALMSVAHLFLRAKQYEEELHFAGILKQNLDGVCEFVVARLTREERVTLWKELDGNHPARALLGHLGTPSADSPGLVLSPTPKDPPP